MSTPVCASDADRFDIVFPPRICLWIEPSAKSVLVALFYTLVIFVALSMRVTIAEADTVDILIENARIVDGAGNPWFRGDVAIKDGRIAAVAPSLDLDARRRIDAKERILAPGFIDAHVHVESNSELAAGSDGIEQQPRADNFLLDGVTTIITGNCGQSEIDIGAWRSRLKGLGINIATLVGHNSIRTSILGRDDRDPSDHEMKAMEELVERAMREGAVGLSTGLAYTPGNYASAEEIVRLAKVAARFGGIYATHIREQGAFLNQSIDEAAYVGEAAGLPVHISHLKVKGRKRWRSIGRTIEKIEAYRSQGLDVTLDAYPYDRASTVLNITLPAWALAGEAPEILARIEGADTRRRIIKDMKTKLAEAGYPNFSYAVVAYFEQDMPLAGKNISEINHLYGNEDTIENEIDVILELMAKSARSGNPYGPLMIYHFMSMDDVDTIFAYKNSIVASDGAIFAFGEGASHPRSYGTNAKILADFVRKRGVLGLEDAVRRMTSSPARRFNFHDRGMVLPGFAADLVLFALERVDDKSTFERPHAFSDGFDYVFVNGVIVVERGTLTDNRPGVFLNGGG